MELEWPSVFSQQPCGAAGVRSPVQYDPGRLSVFHSTEKRWGWSPSVYNEQAAADAGCCVD